MSEQEKTIPTKNHTGLSSALDRFFGFRARGSSLKTEIGAGCLAFFTAVCALLVNTRILGAAYGNYAGTYLAATCLCFAGSLLLGLLCNLPLVQTSNMALSTCVISMLSAAPGITYWNIMSITLVAAVVYLLIALTPLRKLLVDLLPEGVRKALPVGLGLYTILTGLKNAGFVADGSFVDAGQLMTLPRFYFWIMTFAAVIYLILKAYRKNNALLKVYGLMVGAMWVFGIVFYMDQFIGGQTAATLVYHRVNLVVATDGASPYHIGAGLAGLQIGRVFTEGFDFSGYTGNVPLLFLQGVLSFLFLGLYTNTASMDAVAVCGASNYADANGKNPHCIAALLNLAAPILGVAPTSIGAESAGAAEDGGRTGLTSVVASLGFLISAFTWVFLMFFATGTNGAGMWINETETKLAAYVNDSFAFADFIMVLIGVALLKGLCKVNWEKKEEYVSFAVTLIGIAFLGNLALGASLGVIAFAILHLISAERKEKAASTAILCCLMLLYSGLSLTGLSSLAKSDASQGSATRQPLAQVSDFSFDFNTGRYSFTGTEEAQFYVVRVYNVENGTQSVSALAQSERIDKDSSNRYEGHVDADLVAGDYNAYVLAVASGYTPSSTLLSGTSTAMAKPTVSATWQEDGPNVSIKLSIQAGDKVASRYTVTATKDGSEVYRNDQAVNGDLMLSASDLNLPQLSKADKITFQVQVNPVDGYTVPGTVTADVAEERRGGPGGGMAGFEVEPKEVTFEEGAESFTYEIGSHVYFHTTATKAEPAPGTTYTYSLAKGDAQTPFDCKMFLYLNEDGTARLTVSAEGPVAAADLSGTWTSENGQITVTIAK
ncbi:MAG: NCS2 family permease [Lachnospiraceae bacterium]|nr:NCS2 family permease [Lachnospiraceae bacterium]